MFKKTMLVSALFVCFTAQAEQQSNFYVGGQYNKTTLTEKESSFSSSVNFGSLTALAGYKFNDYFAVEARLGTGIKDKSFSEDGYKETFGVDLQTMLLAKASYALSEQFSVFAVGGYSKTEFGYKETGPSYTYSESDSFNGLALGIGAEYKFSNNVALNIEYLTLPDKTYEDIADSFSSKLDGDNLSVGVNYYF